MSPGQQVHERVQLAFWWCGVGMFFTFFAALWPMMEFIPPPSPTLTAEEIVAKYSDNVQLMKAGIIVGIFSSSLLIPWTIMVFMQVQRMEYGRLPVLSFTVLVSGLVNAVFFFVGFIIWAGAFYRMDRDPELILLLNDTAWLEFVMIAPPFFIQLVATGIAILTSTAKREVLPRWFGFLNLWTSVLMLPGVMAIFFYTGPFAWNGLLAWWLVVNAFGIYWIISVVLFRRAIMSHKLDIDSN